MPVICDTVRRDAHMATRTILVTGGEGLLARSLAALSTPERPIVAIGRNELDIADHSCVRSLMQRVNPTAVINAAAMTDVDGCEADPERAARSNVEGPATVARACSSHGSRLLHVSTDFVFDGEKREPYTIDDRPNPLSVYGRTKLAGEEAVRAAAANAIVARTSWVFGVGGKNFASRLFDYAARTTSLKGIVDMRSAPTFAADLAARLLELIEIGASGTFHVTGSGDATWFDVARRMLDVAGRTDVTLTPVTVAELKLPAPRPHYSVMRCLASERLGLSPLRHWHESVAEFVSVVQA